MPSKWQPRPEADSLHNDIINTQLRERKAARALQTIRTVAFLQSCLQSMTSRNTAVYRYHGIFETVYYRRAFPNTAHPYSVRHKYEFYQMTKM